MAETTQPTGVRANTSAGHVSLHVEGAHPPDLRFQFEHEPKRLGMSFVASAIFEVLFAAVVIWATKFSPRAPTGAVLPDLLNPNIVWLSEPGPGGGGGGGGNQMKEPPRPAELPGKDKLTIPVEKPPSLDPPKKPKDDPKPVEDLNIPAKLMASAGQTIPGAIDVAPPSASQGSGVGGGAGTGAGSGIGPGTGSGLGPGTGGGTGGGVYQPGNGVTSPQALVTPKPNYTADAMRARIQGTVWVECIVQTNGLCTGAHIVRSLDPTFGLDQEALKAATLFRFRPGLRLGEPVAVQVTIELSFTLH